MNSHSESIARVEVAPHGMTRSTLLSLVVFAAITPLMLLVAPAVAARLGLQLGLSASQVGTYFFFELGAFSCAALPALLWLGRVDARHVAGVAIAVFCTGNFATALWMPGFMELLVLRSVTALGGGTLMVLCMTSAASSTNRDRVYGLWVVGQLVAGAIGLLILPTLFIHFGLRAVYFLLGVAGLCAAPLVRGFDPSLGFGKSSMAPRAAGPSAAGSRSAWNAGLAVAGIFAFYVTIGGVWTFASKAASLAGLRATSTGHVLAIASLMGIAGAASASLAGGRTPRMAMLVTGYLILALSLGGLATHAGTVTYCASVFAFKFGWTFVLPFILAAAAGQDGTGRLVASLNLVIGAGLAIGPLAAGLLLDRGISLTALFAGAIAVCMASCLCLLRVERH
jgi:predicted MFS family arabinose efflux permease